MARRPRGETAVKIDQLLRDKGTEVATIEPDATVKEAVGMLVRHRVGALVVSDDGRRPQGIVSERDVVRHLHEAGGSLLDHPVSAIMSTGLQLAAPDDDVESLAATMTTHRIRHVPVVVDGALVGIVSIGDVVKRRMDELEADRQALDDYIHAR